MLGTGAARPIVEMGCSGRVPTPRALCSGGSTASGAASPRQPVRWGDFTHSFCLSLILFLNHSRTHSLTHSLIRSLTHHYRGTETSESIGGHHSALGQSLVRIGSGGILVVVARPISVVSSVVSSVGGRITHSLTHLIT